MWSQDSADGAYAFKSAPAQNVRPAPVTMTTLQPDQIDQARALAPPRDNSAQDAYHNSGSLSNQARTRPTSSASAAETSRTDSGERVQTQAGDLGSRHSEPWACSRLGAGCGRQECRF